MEKQMKMIYVCSPLRGDLENNINKAKKYCAEIATQYPGTIPLAPHIYFTQFMDDNVPQERDLALQMGLHLLGLSSEIWVFGIDNPSDGMKGEISYAKNHGIPIKNGFDMIR